MPHLQNTLFKLLPQHDRAIVADRLKPFAAGSGTLLQETDEAVEFVYFPNTGMVSLLVVMADGFAVESAMKAHLTPHRRWPTVSREAAQLYRCP